MRLAFLIRRDNHYRLLGPAIERALGRGWDVECWQPADEGLKGDRRLERRQAGPTFRGGRPRQREFRADGLARLTAEAAPDVVITMYPAPGVGRTDGVRWLGLQYTLNIGELVDGAGRTPFDAIAMHTEHWRALTASSVRILNETRGRGGAPVDDDAIAATLRRRGTVVGFPEMDQCDLIDPAAVRARLGLDPARPVVVYCPFPFLSNPRTFWTGNIYGPFQASARLAAIAQRVPRADGLIRRAERLRQRAATWRPRGQGYAPSVAQGWDDRGVVRAVRAFCDANGAALLVKARAKDPVAAYLGAAADQVLYDASDYPATILEVMSIASLCIHFFSTVAYEAAYVKVPSICVTADADDLGFSPTLRTAYLSTTPGSSFNAPGVTYPQSVGEMVGGFARRRLADFPLEPAARAQYLEKFVGPDDGKASDRLLDAAAALVDGGGRAR